MSAAAPRAVLLGARSVIAQALAAQLAEAGWDLVLAARRCHTLEPVASDLRLRRERRVDLLEFDALDLEGHAELAARIRREAGDFELVICVFGYLGDQDQARSETDEMVRTLGTNFTAAAVCLGHLANDLEARGVGGLIVITSVAGDRGRQSNYTYGAAKGGLALFAQGLRNRLTAAGVHVLTVKPGFVDTPMTEGMKGLFLVASPERVAREVLRAWRRRQNVLYTPRFWRWILLLVRWLPEPLFKRLQL